MKLTHPVVPNVQQICGFFRPGPEGSVQMDNLLKSGWDSRQIAVYFGVCNGII